MKSYYVAKHQLIAEEQFADYSRATGPEPWVKVYVPLAQGSAPARPWTADDDERGRMAKALREAASVLEGGAEYVSGGLRIDLEPGGAIALLSDLRLR